MLTSGTTRLYVVLTTPSAIEKTGQANPPNLFQTGFIRPGISGFYWPTLYVDATQQVIDLPSGTEEIGYSLLGGATITVSESNPPPPTGTSVTTDRDGTSVVLGDAVTITFARTGTPDVHDFVAIVDSLWSIGDGLFGTFTTGGGLYTSSGTSTPGTVPASSGSFETTFQDPGSRTYPVTVWAVLGNDTTSTILAQDTATITITG